MEKEEIEEESTGVSAKKAKETLNLHKIATEVHNDIRPYSGVKAKVAEPATENKDLVGKAFLLIAGKLEEKSESDSDMEKIREIRMAILTGEKY